MSSLLITGGARSGKSRYALAAQPRRERVTLIATAEARDGNMAARIARHRAERPPHWVTIEEPFEVTAVLRALPPVGAVIVDCITLWASNHMLRGDADDMNLAAVDELAQLVPKCEFDVTLVTNEVGDGVHPPTEAGLRFRDLLGTVNQRLAAACDRVVLMVAGLPLTLKPLVPHGNPFQAS